MAQTATSTATLRLGIGDLRIVHAVSVPSGPVRAPEVVPALQGLVNAVVEAAEKAFGGVDIVVSNACSAWTYRHLLPGAARKRWTDRRIERSRYSMSLFVWYFGTRRKYPDVAHHTILLGPRYEALLDDIFRKKVLAKDFSLYLHRPTATDPSLAPDGCSSLYVEVANNQQASDAEVKASVRTFLREHGWLGDDNEVEVEEVRHIRYGYVVFDEHYFPAKQAILGHLQAHDVASLGRYGAWVYSSMEDALWDGYQFAQRLAGAA